MEKKILIVDDQLVNRRILNKMLCDQFLVVEAQNGREALSILKKDYGEIAAVLLDLMMPILDGYGVLKAMSLNPDLAEIPVIVTSQLDKSEAEGRVLELGARDFVSKPYNPLVLRKRLSNLVELYESKVRINHIERDTLTGLYNKDAFCRRATETLTDHPGQGYDLIVADIERFKLVNDSFGTKAGDRLLKDLARDLENVILKKAIYLARFDADHFVALMPRTHGAEGLESMVDRTEEVLADYPLNMKINLKYGIYPIEDRLVAVDLICDRAMLAADSVKGQYKSVCAYYDDAIRQKMLKEQEITNSMDQALKEGQFQVYLQPKYDLMSERIAGSEALVRWIHPTLGFMNPGDFIPLFERNGFITELDRYVWDQTCAIIEAWIATGKKYVPVSVNVSRKDIYQEDLPQIISKIVQSHGLRPSQLHLEITETAYTENPEQLINVVGQLKDAGFIIEMDDFGSGYSSLNMLSELPIDILKLDMRFIQKETNKNSSRNILSFIISLAKWMNLLVVAEGVETQEQIDLLRNMDCNYVQGYYYAKPMTAQAFTEMVLTTPLADPMDEGERNWDNGNLQVGEKTSDKVMLIVDDIELNRTILAEYFSFAYTIVQADNGQVAYQYIEEHFDEISIIMLDLVMPVMDGFQLLKKMHVNPLFSGIPVIVTSQAGETSEAHAFELGASDFLPKPYNMDVAIHRVQNVTARSAVQTLQREKNMLSRMKQLALEAKLDQLTGLFNRMEMERQVQEYCTHSDGKPAGFFMLDIDNFKHINDIYGHDRGDETLKLVANRLSELFRADDLICRMGGDEFAVFMRADLSELQLARRLNRMCEKLRFTVEKIEISCSIGVCAFPKNGTDYQTLYHNADVALLTAKRMGKNRWQIFGGEDELPNQILYRNMDWLLDESSDAIVVSDNETNEVYYVNDATCAMVGKTKGACMGEPCYRVIWNKESECENCPLKKGLSREYAEYEMQNPEMDSSYLLKGKIIDWGSRKARIQYIQDNTDRARLLKKMEEVSEDRQMLLDLLPGGLFRYNAKTQEFNFVSENTLHMLGYTREAFTEKFKNRFDLMVWHEDRNRVLNEIDEQIAVGFYDTCEYRIEKADGSLCWVFDAGYFHKNEEDGEYYVILLDLTNQKEMELENKKLTRQLENIVDNSPGALCMYRYQDDELEIVTLSQQFPQIVGVTVEEAAENARQKATNHVHPDDSDIARKAMGRVLRGAPTTECACRVFHKPKGEYIWIRMQMVGKPQEDGSVLVFALYTDISELHELKIQLQDQRDMLTAAMEHSGMSCWVYDFNTKSTAFETKKQRGSKLKEFPLPVFQKMGPHGYLDENSFTKYEAMLNAIKNGAAKAEEDLRVILPKSQKSRWKRTMVTAIAQDETGKPTKAVGTALDITEQKLVEQMMDSLMETKYNAIALLDARTGAPEILCGAGLDSVLHEQERLKSYTAGVEARLRAICHPDDLEDMIKDTRLNPIKLALETTPLYTVTFRQKDNKKRMGYRLCYRYLDHEHTTILCTLEEII